MEGNLEALIDKIKKEGVEEAKKASREIMEKAKEEANEIIEKARRERERLIQQAQQESLQLKKRTEAALKQAARDFILKIREELKNLFDRMLKECISKELTPEFLKNLIIKVVENWAEGKKPLEVLVSQKDKERLEELVFSQLKREAQNGLVIKVSKDIESGFRIGIKGEDLHYDFSDETIAESLKEFLNPTITSIINEASQG